MKLFGSLASITFSPIVTIEPRRRKFHCPIRLKIPLPAGYRADTSANLRLLCSITGGQNRAVWEDVTGSTPLSMLDDCLLFTTTVSARFWLVHCQRAQHCPDSSRYAHELYRRLIAVPFMAKFVVFAKRRDINEANLRVFCMTDDKEERTLEVQEHYSQVARSRDVEVLEGQPMYLEFGGNLVPAHLSGWARSHAAAAPINSLTLINEQLAFTFHAFQENRLAFVARLKEIGQEPTGRLAFMEDSIKYLASLNSAQRAYLNERRRRAICTLGVALPPMCVSYDDILGTPKRNSYLASARIGDLSLADIASELLEPGPAGRGQSRDIDQDSLTGDRPTVAGPAGAAAADDWLELAPRLGIPRDEVEFIADYCHQTPAGRGVSPALILLLHWYKLASPETRDQDLARALVAIGRADLAARLNFAIEPKRISRSTMELLREIESIPVRSAENLYTGSELSDYPSQRPASRGTGSLRRLNDGAAEQQQQLAARRSSARAQSSAGSRGSLEQQQQQQQPAISQQDFASQRQRQRAPLGQRPSAELNAGPASAAAAAAGAMETRVSSREWTETDQDGKLSYRLEQTTSIESKSSETGGSSRKQRRRKG